MDFTPDGRFWAAGRGDGTVALYEADSDSPLACFSLESTVQSLRFAPHAPVLAASAGCVTKVFNYEDGAVLGIFEHPELVRGAAWSPDGALMATACADGCVYVWDSRTGELRRRLKRHPSAAVYVTFNHRGNLLASHGWDGHTQIWDVGSGAALLRVPGLAICFDAADGRLAFGGAGLGVWRFAAGLERRALQAGPSERLWGAETAPDSRFAALARQDGVRFWDLAAGVEMGALDIGPVRLASFERDGRGLITWGSAGLLRWPLGSTRQNADELEIGPPEPLGLPASSLPEFAAVSADGRLLAAADRSYGELYLYDLVDRRLVFRGPHANASRIAISPDGAWVVGGTWGDPHPALRRWDARLLVQADYWPSVNGAAPAFSPDSRWLWLGTSPGGRLLDVASWQATRNDPVAGPAAGVAIFSPDSSLLVVNAAPDRLQMINPLTGREIAALETSTPLCFNREGSLLLTQSDDQAVYLWDLAIIRRRLAELNLDWQDAPLPASKLDAPQRAPLRVRVLG
ncbi:MAG TPA: WD40 repeat domain-containing protein, partial [Thermomicrobiales bacterium]|nr:WD40 repeat domain-containing protein [Thermomicrobiales bacterium]